MRTILLCGFAALVALSAVQAAENTWSEDRTEGNTVSTITDPDTGCRYIVYRANGDAVEDEQGRIVGPAPIARAITPRLRRDGLPDCPDVAS